MLRLIKLFPVALLILAAGSCSKDDENNGPVNYDVNFAATLNGANESTPNASTATGTAAGVFNTSTKILTVTTTYTGVVATNGHIHKAAVGVPGPVVFPFTSLTSPIVFTSAALDAAQEADLMANLYYVNIHSAAFPGGEIRGQLLKQ